MILRRLALAFIISAALILIGSPSYAGSDSPTPYTVTVDGIQLPAGATFTDGGHVNVKSNQGDRGIHFEALNNQPSGQWIGASFLPWSAFGFDTATVCVSWVQLSQYNEHFGEGGQAPIGNGCAPVEPSPEPTVTVTPEPEPSTTVTPTPEPSVTVEPTTGPTVTPKPQPSSIGTPHSTIAPTQEPPVAAERRTLAASGPDNRTRALITLGGLAALGLGIGILYTRLMRKEDQ